MENVNVTDFTMMTVQEVQDKIKSLQSLLPVKAKKETPAYILERRGFNTEIRNELFNFGSVQRAANKKLNESGSEGFIKLLSEKQIEKFVSSRLVMAIKSKKLLLKVTNKGNDILTLTPNHYLNLIASFCTLTQKEFNKRRGQ